MAHEPERQVAALARLSQLNGDNIVRNRALAKAAVVHTVSPDPVVGPAFGRR